MAVRFGKTSVIFTLAVASQTIAVDARAMDLVRTETRVDQAVAKFGVTGKGVLVGVMDRGIDWQNDDFRNDDGTTRIEYIFDLTDDSGAGAPGNSYGLGTIYTRQQINAALSNGTPLATRDASGHGSTTTGIIAGNGSNLFSRKYRGVAPEATIISVKIVGGAAGNNPEPYFYQPHRVPVAIDFLRDKAAALGKPCVMLLNIGTQEGPTDGTSALARKIDATVGAGKPGLVFVTGPGDDGGMSSRAGGTVPQGQSRSIRINKGSVGTLQMDLWYGGNDRFNVTVVGPSGSRGPYAAPANNDSLFVSETDFTLKHQGSDQDLFAATNGKREILLELSGPVGTYTVVLAGASVSSGRFDATLNPSLFWFPDYSSNRFETFVASGSIWDGATAFNNICPGDYVIRNTWTDVNGQFRSITGEGNPGQLWKGSSVGPTFDGRLGVDLVTPGDHVWTTKAPLSYYAEFPSNEIQDGGGFYTRASAVSASAPIATGVIALMLQRNPKLDAAMVKSILQKTARADSFTGTVPNTRFGYGKVDALAAVSQAIIRNFSVKDTSNAADWSIRSNLQLGNVAYGDRTFTWTQVPTALRGKEWIRTANDSKAFTGATLVTFTVNVAATVYVCHKDSAPRPSWISSASGWTDSGLDMKESSNSSLMSCHKKAYAKDANVSLGRNGNTSASMYTVVISTP